MFAATALFLFTFAFCAHVEALQFSSLWSYHHSSGLTFPVIDERSIYSADNAGRVMAFDKVSGRVLWSVETGMEGAPAAHPTVSGEYLTVQGVINQTIPAVFVLNTTNGDQLFAVRLRYAVNIHVTIYRDVMYYSTEPNLWNATMFATHLKTGKLLWSKYYKACTRVFPNGDYIYFGTHDGTVAVHALSGAQLWAFSTNGKATNEPNAHGDAVYFADFHTLRAVNRSNGKLLWATKITEGDIANGATVHRGVVYFELFEKDVFALNATTGAIMAKTTNFSAVSKDFLVVHDEHLIVPSIGTNRLYAFPLDLFPAGNFSYAPPGGWTSPDSWPNEIVVDQRAEAGFVVANNSLWAIKLF